MAEQLLLLSTNRNLDFELGRHNAAAFSTILFGTQTLAEHIGLANLERGPNKLENEPLKHAHNVRRASLHGINFSMRMLRCVAKLTHDGS